MMFKKGDCVRLTKAGRRKLLRFSGPYDRIGEVRRVWKEHRHCIVLVKFANSHMVCLSDMLRPA